MGLPIARRKVRIAPEGRPDGSATQVCTSPPNRTPAGIRNGAGRRLPKALGNQDASCHPQRLSPGEHTRRILAPGAVVFSTANLRHHAMHLRHSHAFVASGVPQPAGRFAGVDSGWVGISRTGKTILWSTAFSGCIGVVMCGETRNWGALAHMNQCIQDATRNLELALSTVATFVRNEVNDDVTDVMIYYGDFPANRGQNQMLTKDRIRGVMGCRRVIDLRRTGQRTRWGSDFLYDPGMHIVHTVASGLALDVRDPDDARHDARRIIRKPFPYPGDDAKRVLSPGLGHKGYFFVA